MKTRRGSLLRWGILSTARINRRIIPAIRSVPHSRLAAVASRSPARAASFARLWRIPKAYAGYAALLSDPAVDAVYLPLPNHLHAAWILRSLAAGKHVLCEKPLALSDSECIKMIRYSGKARRFLMEGMMYRFHPQIAQALRWLKQGRIGKLERILITFSVPLNRPGNYRWFEKSGGGALWDTGCYAVDFARTVAGREPVRALGHCRRSRSGVDAAFFGLLIFPGGRVAQIDCGIASAYRRRAEIAGEKGTILLENPWHGTGPAALILRRNDGRSTRIHYPPQDSYRRELIAFRRSALGGASPLPGLSFSLGNVRALQALRRSASGRSQWVRIAPG